MLVVTLVLATISFGSWLFMHNKSKSVVVNPAPKEIQETPFEETPKNESLIVTTPKKDALVSSPLELRGEVRGTWLFEATAPVTLTDWDGRIIAEGYIEAQEDWMTTEFVPFAGELIFETPADIGDFSDRGSIIFRNSNPSGLPENAAFLEYTVRFR